MVKQTAGRDALNDFAPKFAQLNDDVLFGEVWSREDKLSLKTRSIVTITSLISKGIVDHSLKYHLTTARKNGVTKTEMADMLHFMQAGRMRGLHFTWQRKCMQMTVRHKNTADCLVRATRTRHMQSTLSATAI